MFDEIVGYLVELKESETPADVHTVNVHRSPYCTSLGTLVGTVRFSAQPSATI